MEPRGSMGQYGKASGGEALLFDNQAGSATREVRQPVAYVSAAILP